MDTFKNIIGDLAIVGIIAAFLDMLLPNGTSKNGVKLVFGLYFMAILLNPLVGFFCDDNLAALDFRSLSVENEVAAEEFSETEILDAAAASLGKEIETKCEALYEVGSFTVTVTLSSENISEVSVACKGISAGKERVAANEIKTFIAKDYGVKKSKVEVVF